MPEEEIQDVQPDSSPGADEQSESSTEALEEATSQQAEQEQEQHVPYDRFKEVNEEKKYWQDKFSDLASKQQQLPQPQTPQQEADMYAGMDAQTKVFYQDLDARNKRMFQQMFEEKEKNYTATIQALAQQNARIQEKLFRQEQVDVKPGSKEEAEIANLIRAGVDPDKAAWAVMGPKRVEAAKSLKQQQQQKKTQQKAQANLETGGVPSHSGLPTGEKLSFREDLDRRMKAAEKR